MTIAENPGSDETLPRWDLTDLYPAPDSPEIDRDLAVAAQESEALEATYKGRIAALPGEELGDLIRRYEVVDETLTKLGSYGSLVRAGDMLDPEIGKFCQSLEEKIVAVSSHLLFLGLEINRIDEAEMARKLEAPALAHYGPWLRDLRMFREHQLSDELEGALHELHVVHSAWDRLFNQTIAALRFDVRGQSLPISDVLNMLTDRDGDKRRDAALALGKGLEGSIQTFALITNTLAKEKQIQDQWRKYPRPVSARNLENQVEDEVVDALVSAVRDSYPRLSHRYYALKAKWLGRDRLDYWDRNAPLPDQSDRVIPWQDAKRIVRDAYHDFSPELAEIGQRFFDHDWIDVGPRPEKNPGAFAHPVVPSAHPYLLLNYHGKIRDVTILAHELGHGVHQVLAGAQGQLMSSTPLTLAETASVFGEMLTFKALVAAETDPRRRKAMLAGKVEDMLNTVVRQISFYDFERRLHDRRAEAELTADEIGDIWMEVQAESLGPAIRLDDTYRPFWAYIPHFIHSPFYVYAYAFGDCLVNALYAEYERAEAGFQDRYLAMLSAGGTKRHKELLAPFGLDASDPGFWRTGLGVIERMIDELEKD
jgi:oligoendopeptidase F